MFQKVYNLTIHLFSLSLYSKLILTLVLRVPRVSNELYSYSKLLDPKCKVRCWAREGPKEPETTNIPDLQVLTN